MIEDEVHESEVLVANGTHRTYVKANAVCQTGSNLTATVGREEDATAVPIPTGARAS